jgi:pimeloyl-ACP methyl ester carboxylesterase
MSDLHVIEHGVQSDRGAPPLLFVHGACLGAWCWEDHFLGYFGQLGYHTAALDLRGHGRSAGRNKLQAATIDDFVNDVLKVVSRFEIPPIVVGHSMGGLIAQRLAAQHPLSGVVLLASSPVGGMKRPSLDLVRAHPLPFLKAILLQDMHRIYPDNRRVRHIMFSPNTPELTVTRCRERLQSESWAACMEMNNPVSPPSNLSCPMLVLGGELDQTVPQEAVLETGKAYHAPTHIFPGVGHNLMLEPSWENVAHYIDQWIQAGIHAERNTSK